MGAEQSHEEPQGHSKGQLKAKSKGQPKAAAQKSTAEATKHVFQECGRDHRVAKKFEENDIFEGFDQGDRVSRCKAIFAQHDNDLNGKLSRREFANVAKALCPQIPNNKVSQLFDQVDRNGSGTIEQSEFFRWVFTEEVVKKKGSEILNRHDKNDDAKLNLEEFTSVCKSLLPQFTDNMITLMFKYVDVDRSGKIEMDEFLEWVFQFEVQKMKKQNRFFHRDLILTCKALFTEHDTNKDGILSYDEFKNAAKDLIPRLGSASMGPIFNSADLDSNGTVELEEFLKWVFEDEVAKKKKTGPPAKKKANISTR